MDAHRLISECPVVIGLITSTLQSGGSIDSAIRAVADKGPSLSKCIFEKAVRSVDTKGSRSLTDSLRDQLSQLPKGAEGFTRSITMSLSASDANDDITRERLLEDSSDIALEAVRLAGESYGSSLNIPCMTVFGLGIMAPMILMSIMPMMSIGGVLGKGPLDLRMVSLITLVLIPSLILLVSIRIHASNPFQSDCFSVSELSHGIPLLIAFPLAAFYQTFIESVQGILMLSVFPACIFTAFLISDDIRKAVRLKKMNDSITESVLDIGNRMISGENYEVSLIESLKTNKETRKISGTFSRSLALCRGNVYDAIERTFGRISSELCSILTNVFSCSVKDNTEAGRLAMTLGKQLHNRSVSQKEIELKLKSTTDMMVGTGMLFAPMVLGMSISMMEPLSKMIAGYSVDGSSLMLGIYLIELCMLMSIFVSTLGRDGNILSIIWRFCIMCPVSTLVFWACSSLSL